MLIAEHFIGKGLTVLVYGPKVPLSNLLGANRRFTEQHMPHLGSLIRRDLGQVVAESDGLVVGLNDASTVAVLRGRVREEQTIVDLVVTPGRDAPQGRDQGLCC